MSIFTESYDVTDVQERRVSNDHLQALHNENAELRRTIARLEAAESRYELAIRGSGVAIWDWNIADNRLHMSDTFFDMLGARPDTYITDIPYTIGFLHARIHPEDREDFLSVFDAHLERGFLFSAECRLMQDNGGYRHVSISAQAQWDNERTPVRMAGAVTDISDRYRAIKQLSSSNDSLQRFAYICSHDLKEPARIVDNFSRLLEKQYADHLDERAAEFIEHIRISAVRMQDMIQSILDYSQAEHKHLTRETVDCRVEVEKALENLTLSIEEAGADILIGSLPRIDADRTQIFQLFLNLIGNALKFRGKEAPVVTISAKKQLDSWLFSVKDNGIGMEQRHADSIFGVFRRLHDTSEYAGTGIGLSICYRVVEKHHGKIWVESSPGNGSVFYFTIPTMRCDTRGA